MPNRSLLGVRRIIRQNGFEHEFTQIYTKWQQTMALTNAEIEFMAKTTASLRNIDKQLGRIADALEKIVSTSNEPTKGQSV